ncbi:uncharacterized protein LOC128989728 [Macrosteles quadrilineatus]|uniref:uncharacterized protein LOC128989728 n=1 Tax=Macrosteles quadrilineatus TaxID=74068 RepID=UPI0023E279D1|nr:uncharacterized protein LOC128989728 [Macrosteles quadrilineatus]
MKYPHIPPNAQPPMKCPHILLGTLNLNTQLLTRYPTHPTKHPTTHEVPTHPTRHPEPEYPTTHEVPTHPTKHPTTHEVPTHPTKHPEPEYPTTHEVPTHPTKHPTTHEVPTHPTKHPKDPEPTTEHFYPLYPIHPQIPEIPFIPPVYPSQPGPCVYPPNPFPGSQFPQHGLYPVNPDCISPVTPTWVYPSVVPSPWHPPQTPGHKTPGVKRKNKSGGVPTFFKPWYSTDTQIAAK